jgi:hypothetical protein
MNESKAVEYIHEGCLVAEFHVTALENDSTWSPFYRPDDVRKLESVRDALRRGDVAAASPLARIYELTPIAAE